MNDARGFDLFGLSEARFETVLLVAVRITVMLVVVPIFSGSQIPPQVRIGLGVLVAFVVAQTVPTLPGPLALGPLTVAILAQGVIGLAFGYVAMLVFTGIQFGGSILDIQVGFASVSVLNPTTQQQVTILSEFVTALASILYLALNAHHLLIQGIADSFGLLPLPNVGFDPAIVPTVVAFLEQALFIVFRIAAPVAIVLFITNATLALMSRVAPQISIFSVGLPLQMLVGLTMIIVCMPLFGAVLPEVFAQTPRELDTLMRHMQVQPGSVPVPLPTR